MPTVDWLKNEFDYGYTSGDILSLRPDAKRASEEKECGGSYYHYFQEVVLPLLKPDFRVLELGPGAGDWTRALLTCLPQGEVHTCDFQDAAQWTKAEDYPGRLFHHQVQDNSFNCLPDDYFDLFFSFGVLVHCNQPLIEEIMHNVLPKMKSGAQSLHNHTEWNKLTDWGWDRGHVPQRFQQMDDDDIWWPRNSTQDMTALCQRAGWKVVQEDMRCFLRDGVILLKKS